MVIKVPINNITKEQAEKSLSELISRYKEDVDLTEICTERKNKIDKILSKINPLK